MSKEGVSSAKLVIDILGDMSPFVPGCPRWGFFFRCENTIKQIRTEQEGIYTHTYTQGRGDMTLHLSTHREISSAVRLHPHPHLHLLYP